MTSDKESTRIIDREKQLLIRNKQMMEIKNAMDSNVDNLFISGIPSTGKTLVLKSMMREVSNVAWINCVDCLSARIVFERALSQWFEFDDRCENEDQFVYQLQCFHQQGSRLILVLDKVDELMSIGSATLLPFLFRLRDISRVDIMMISISHLKFDTLLTLPLPYPPMTVQFPIYTKPEMINIIGLDCPETEDIGFFKSFIELIYNSFNSTCCQDLNELRYMVLMLFPKYIEPITNGLLERNQTSRLFSNIQKEIKDAFHNLYLRNISANEWNEHLETSSVLRVNTKRMDLPHYTKFLVMASFLASYNPARLDKRFFTRGGEGKTRVGKKGGVNNGSKLRQQLLGPKSFTVERMIAIFYSIIDDDDLRATFDIHTQISTLISLRLLLRVTGFGKLDAMKCKCNVSYGFVKEIGKSVRFDISKYLFDWVDV